MTILAFILAVGCKQKETKTETDKATVVEETAETSEEFCFKNEYPYKDGSDMADVMELNFTVNGNDVTGEYNWLPAEKDQRKGSFTGKKSGNNVSGKYVFMQEGIEDTVDISIQLSGDEAQVNGGDASLGLNATLEKIDCE